ncbi:caspase domain-containing protein [Earliella scabrosa]|nr:caspase domain-containing protein [Earliella scabrosa]
MSTIIRRFTKSSSTCSKTPSSPPTRTPIRRALIIGINYVGKPHELRGAQDDAKRWMNLCMKTYSFRRSDITLMLDDKDTPSHLQPTHANLLEQITRLPQGLELGDEVVLFYSGHSGQVESKDPDEDDGLDECLVPVDYDWADNEDRILRTNLDKLIIDNELRRLLVDPLPVGSKLTAVFDACHSGTLLDLNHYLCNEIVFPSTSRGLRRPCSRWMNVREYDPRLAMVALMLNRIEDVGRKDGHDMRNYGVRVVRRTERQEPNRARSASLRNGVKDVRIHRFDKIAPERALSIGTSLELLAGTAEQENGRKQYQLTTHETYLRTPSLPGLGNRGQSDHAPPSTSLSFGSVLGAATAYDSVQLTRCASPEQIASRTCDGNCVADDRPGPHVVSISACHDQEFTYDTRDRSMTKILVEILEMDPHPCCRTLVQNLGYVFVGLHPQRIFSLIQGGTSFKLIGFANGLMDRNKANMEKNREAVKKRKRPRRPVLDVDFFTPQLGSHTRLLDDDCFMKWL